MKIRYESSKPSTTTVGGLSPGDVFRFVKGEWADEGPYIVTPQRLTDAERWGEDIVSIADLTAADDSECVGAGEVVVVYDAELVLRERHA